jgi:hypothetical protein
VRRHAGDKPTVGARWQGVPARVRAEQQRVVLAALGAFMGLTKPWSK